MAALVNPIRPEQILAVLVVYGEAPLATQSWQSLQATEAGKRLHWLIYDNSPGSAAQLQLPENIRYEHHPDNKGVSAAYLRAAVVGAALGAQWLLLLDQDSVFAPDWFEAYTDAIETDPNTKIMVPVIRHNQHILSPATWRWGRTWTSKQTPPSTFSLQQFAPINAGMLIELAAYRAAGGHLREVAVDFSDFAFIYFFRRHFPTATLVNTTVAHRLSGAEAASYQQRLQRFEMYCRDGLAFVQKGGPRSSILGWMAWRALILSLRYKRLGFFWVFSRVLHAL